MMQVPTPTADKLEDLFYNCSVAIFVSDGSGRIVLGNKAGQVLVGQQYLGQPIQDFIGIADDWNSLRQALSTVGLAENVPCSVSRGSGSRVAIAANVSAASGEEGTEFMFWILRPELTSTLPAEGSATPALMTDAGEWISDVNAEPVQADSGLTTGQVHEVLALFFHHAPVGIHLLANDGSVQYANKYDIGLVGHEEDPGGFLGHHVEQVYQDHHVVEDFMGRWGEDAPIINFRANFVRKDGKPEPVLIYSTANAEGGFQNTRCLVFRDPRPDLPRSNVSAFDFRL